MKTTMSQGETVASWSVIGNKVYRDNVLFAKASNWPDAIAIRDALSCHDALLEACKVVCQMFDDEVFIYGVDDRDKVLKWLRQAARAIAKATTQKEGAK